MLPTVATSTRHPKVPTAVGRRRRPLHLHRQQQQQQRRRRRNDRRSFNCDGRANEAARHSSGFVMVTDLCHKGCRQMRWPKPRPSNCRR